MAGAGDIGEVCVRVLEIEMPRDVPHPTQIPTDGGIGYGPQPLRQEIGRVPPGYERPYDRWDPTGQGPEIGGGINVYDPEIGWERPY